MVIRDNNTAYIAGIGKPLYHNLFTGALVPLETSISAKAIIVINTLIWTVLSGLFFISAAQAQPFTPNPSGEYQILRHGDIIREDLTELPLAEAIGRYKRGEAQKAANAADDTDLVYGPVWLRLLLSNPSTQPARYRLDTRLSTANVQTAYVIDNDKPVRIWHDDWLRENYTTRYPKQRLVASAPFTLAPKTNTELWIFYPFGFYLNEEIWLIEEGEFLDRRDRDNGFSIFIFGLRVALIAGIFAFAVVLRFRTAYYYGFFSIALLAFFAQGYGYTYAHLFKDYNIDSIFRLLAGSIGLTFFTLMTRSFLNTQKLYPGINRALFASMGLAVMLAVIALLDGPHLLGQMLISAGAILITLTNLFAICWGVYRGHSGASLFLIATVFLLANMLVGILVFPPFNLISSHMGLDINHLGFALDTLLFAGALIVRAMAMKDELTTAHEANIAALSQQSLLADKLSTVSAKHDHAVALAEARRRELAETTHDLKQPLLSLKLSLKNRKDVEAVSQGISYLQGVVDRTLEDTKPDNIEPIHHSLSQPAGDGANIVKIQTLLDNIVTMFADEAKAKNISLKAIPTSKSTTCEPVLLMRLLINLVANAVKHTQSGRIIIGARHRGCHIAIQIFDTGPGIEAMQLEEIFKPYKSGHTSKGEGLGLSIVKQLAEANGLTISVCSQIGKGSVFEISGIELGKSTLD